MKKSLSGYLDLSPRLVVPLLIGLIFLVYLNALSNGFVWDDKCLILENDSIRSIKNIPQIFCAEFELATTNTGFYRPLVLLSLLLDNKLWGLNPAGFHLTNIILHILTTIFIYFLILRLFQNRGVSFLTALLFALHPIHTSNVSWISGRGDVLCALFYIVSLILFVKSISRDNPLAYSLYGLSLFSFYLALSAKEMAISLPVIILLYFFCFQRQNSDRFPWPLFWKRCFPYFIIAGIYIIVRVFVIGQAVRHSLHPELLPARMITMADIIIRYLSLLIFPARLNFYYVTPLMESIIDSRFIFSLFILIAIAWITIRLYRRFRGIFFAILWFFITLLPVSNIIPLWSTMMAEHWLYIPSIGFCLFAGLILVRLPRQQTILAIFCGFLIASSLAIIAINRTWKNELIFYLRMTKVSPEFYLGHYNLGNVYFRKGETDLAIVEYNKALDLNPDYVSSYVNLGGAYNKKGLFNEAIELFNIALAMKPDDEEIQANIKIAQENKAKISRSAEQQSLEIETQLQEAIAKNPEDPNIYNNLGVYYAKAGRIDEALAQFEKAVALKPQDIKIYLNLAQAYAVKGMNDEAIKTYEEVLEKDPNEIDKDDIRNKIKMLQGI